MSFFDRVKATLIGERTVDVLDIIQEFPIYGIDNESYRLEFLENFFGFRSIRIISSDFCFNRKLWMATEFYVFTVLPWIQFEISNEALKSHVDIISGIIDDMEETPGVIQINKFKKKPKKRRDLF